MPTLLQRRELITGQRLGSGLITYGTGGGSALPLGVFVINGVPMVINSIPIQKAS